MCVSVCVSVCAWGGGTDTLRLLHTYVRMLHGHLTKPVVATTQQELYINTSVSPNNAGMTIQCHCDVYVYAILVSVGITSHVHIVAKHCTYGTGYIGPLEASNCISEGVIGGQTKNQLKNQKLQHATKEKQWLSVEQPLTFK